MKDYHAIINLSNQAVGQTVGQTIGQMVGQN